MSKWYEIAFFCYQTQGQHIRWTFNLIWWLCPDLQLTSSEIYGVTSTSFPRPFYRLPNDKKGNGPGSEVDVTWKLRILSKNFNRILNLFIVWPLPGEVHEFSGAMQDSCGRRYIFSGEIAPPHTSPQSPGVLFSKQMPLFFLIKSRTLLLVLSMIVEYCQCVDLMPMLTTDIMTRLFELMKVCSLNISCHLYRQ